MGCSTFRCIERARDETNRPAQGTHPDPYLGTGPRAIPTGHRQARPAGADPVELVGLRSSASLVAGLVSWLACLPCGIRPGSGVSRIDVLGRHALVAVLLLNGPHANVARG